MSKSKYIQQRVLPYFKSLAMIALVTVLGLFVRKVVGPMNLNMFYLLIVVMTAVRWGRGPAIMTSVVSLMVFNQFFVEQHTAAFGFDMQSAFVLIGFLVVGFVVGSLASKTRQQAIDAKEREKQVTMLYHLSKDLAAANSFENVLEIIRMNVGKIFNCHVAIFLLTDQKLDVTNFDPGFPLTQQEKTIAGWVSEHGKPAGLCTENFTDSKVQFLPLITSQGTAGVLGISFKENQLACDLRENYLLSTLANQAAIAIQRTKLAEVSRQLELMRETEKLQTALLNSISHDLKTPLVSIMGVLDTLLHDFSSLDQQTRVELLATAYEDSDHLNRIVSNLLDMTRLEAKALKIHIEPCELRDVIGSSLQPLKGEIEKRNIQIHIPEDFPEVPMDFVLMMRVFNNLFDNAVKYSKPATKIEIAAERLDGHIKIDVKDEGIGIPKDDLVKIFDKFYRAVNPREIMGTGLGLSICKGIVEVHGGEIFARNNPDKGSTMSVILPLNGQEK